MDFTDSGCYGEKRSGISLRRSRHSQVCEVKQGVHCRLRPHTKRKAPTRGHMIISETASALVFSAQVNLNGQIYPIILHLSHCLHPAPAKTNSSWTRAYHPSRIITATTCV
ncbi:hypothetical protein LshimejAT787_1203260 [Lyophyllum shimeji]|uniref:Uncharacterized protein n=1 Tax=Lyophyllum shimeji TaxID=47721 RepID=A0A9P3PU21_LYOSH|nr:hypothetical protein LshimejAT787_1203260 [Lyophyllum shimeji]